MRGPRAAIAALRPTPGEPDALGQRTHSRGAALSIGLCAVIVAASEHERRFFERLDDDLDTPGALVELDDLAQRIIESRAEEGSGVDGGELLARLLGILGAGTEPVAA